ncbi:serine hydrolase-like protein 2 isoform X2 [Uloborus diversus]|nr:serine hydrolase-like protein 2 isoform X2 [Uloborus diversus]
MFHEQHSSGRKYCSSASSNVKSNYLVKELNIPIPYGHIAAKCWGAETGIPVLALHGWLDNSGTFDKLIPLLSQNFFIVAIDAPGHGRSSHRPLGCVYTDVGMLMDFKRVIEYLNWNKFHLMGHSLGGALALMFTSLFPSLVEKVVVLDIAKPTSRPVTSFPHETINAIQNHFKNESKMNKDPPVYTIETAAQRLKEGMYNEVTLEGARILNQRGTRASKCGKGVVFSRDIRCRTIEQFSRRSHEFVEQCMSQIHTEILMIMANNTHPNYASSTPEVIETFFGIYKKNSRNFQLKHVDGNHFVHLNNPERIAPFINDFLLNNNEVKMSSRL